MIAAVLLSMLVMPVVAADEQEPETRGSTLTYGVSSSYDVEIPETLEFNAGAYVTASDVIINDGAALVVTVDSGYNWKLQLSDENANDVLNYQMFIGGSTSAAVDDAVVINIAHPATGDSVKLEFTTEDTAKKSGSYKDTLTFTIEVKEGAASEANSNILLINDLDGLKSFRDDVNNGNSYSGWTIKLMDDIDLNNDEWIPIGFNDNDDAETKTNDVTETPFSGIFDGQGYTIKNLKTNKQDKGGLGLFGVVKDATFKNIILENVDIKAYEDESETNDLSGGEYIVGGQIGSLVGYNTGKVTFENVHVKGTIKIEGETDLPQGQRIGGIIGGKGSGEVTFNDVSVIGDESSYIKGYCSVGGVAGQLQGKSTFTNVKTDIYVEAVQFAAGGIIGLVAPGSTFDDCKSSGDIKRTLAEPKTKNNYYRVGGIAGSWSDSAISGLVLTNCEYTGTLSSVYPDTVTLDEWDCEGLVGRGYNLIDKTTNTIIQSTVTIKDTVNGERSYLFINYDSTTGYAEFTISPAE